MDFKLCARPLGPHVVVKVFGELDLFTAPELRTFLIDTLQWRGCHIVLDCSDLGFADSSGLAVLVGVQRRARRAGGSLRLAGLPTLVADQLAVTGLHKVIPTYPTLQAAAGVAETEARTPPLLADSD